MNKLSALLVSATALLACSAALADQKLAQSKNCMTCHGVDNKIVGPGFKEIAKKYAGNKAAVDQLATKIIKGGSGVWGAIPMPANTQVSEAEARKLSSWILGLK